MTVLRRYILGSRSPRRRELLGLVVPDTQIDVVPPPNAAELDFEGLTIWPEIRERLEEIVRGKSAQLEGQLSARDRHEAVCITADTAVIVAREASSSTLWEAHSLLVLGQPPEHDDWPATVRRWFLDHYAGRTHWTVTALRLESFGKVQESITISSVTMRPDVNRWLDWYLATGESRGKAGGYALQGAGSIFITGVKGSLTNVVGLPLEALVEGLAVLDPSHD